MHLLLSLFTENLTQKYWFRKWFLQGRDCSDNILTICFKNRNENIILSSVTVPRQTSFNLRLPNIWSIIYQKTQTQEKFLLSWQFNLLLIVQIILNPSLNFYNKNVKKHRCKSEKHPVCLCIHSIQNLQLMNTNSIQWHVYCYTVCDTVYPPQQCLFRGNAWLRYEVLHMTKHSWRLFWNPVLNAADVPSLP